MKDSKPDWDALIPLLYKEFWAENEAIYILAGIKPNESETSFTSLRTGKRVPASEAKYLYKHIFDSWTGDSHPWTEGILYSASYTSWNDYNKYYYLHWVAQKPFIEVEWLDWAYSEGHLKEDEKRRIAKLIDGNVLSIKTEAKPDEVPKRGAKPNEVSKSEQKLENVYRVTGLLLKVLKEKKFTQKSLMERMQTYYDPDAPENANKGLKETTVEEVFAASNKALKRLLESEDDF